MNFAPRQDFSPKLQGSTIPLEFNFTSQLPPSDSIVSAVTTCFVYSGIDPSPSALISGSSSASGAVVTQNVTAGVAGVIYYLLCSATTTNGLVLQLAGYLAVLPNPVP